MALKEAINRQIITQDTVIPVQRHRESTANQLGAGRESMSVTVGEEESERERLCAGVGLYLNV